MSRFQLSGHLVKCLVADVTLSVAGTNRSSRRPIATILSVVPGCEPDAWMSDYAMPERAVAPEEQIWSNIMDPAAAAKFLDQQP